MKDIIARILAPATAGGNLSIGRLLLLTCFALSMWKWGNGQDIVSTQLTVLLALIGYVFGTKVLDGVMEAKNSTQPQPDPEAKGD